MDIVRGMNGEIFEDNAAARFSATVAAWQAGDDPLLLTIERRGDTGSAYSEYALTPAWDEAYGRYRIGVTVGQYLRQEYRDGQWVPVTKPISIGQAVTESWSTCINAGSAIYNALKDLFTTGKGFEETTGPVGVVTVVSQQVRDGGMEQFFWLLCLISINVGIMNLLPIPGLDGSRFLFMVYEAVMGKPVPQRKEAMVHTIGMLLLLGMMLFFTFRDVLRLFH